MVSEIKLAKAIESSEHQFKENEILELVRETTNEYESDLEGGRIFRFRQVIGELEQELEEHEFEWMDESEWNIRLN